MKKAKIGKAPGTVLQPDSKAAARVKLARLLEAENPTPTEATRPETFEEAARRIAKGQKAEGKTSYAWHLREALWKA